MGLTVRHTVARTLTVDWIERKLWFESLSRLWGQERAGSGFPKLLEGNANPYVRSRAMRVLSGSQIWVLVPLRLHRVVVRIR